MPGLRLLHTGDERHLLDVHRRLLLSHRMYPFLRAKPAGGWSSSLKSITQGTIVLLQGPGLDALDKERRIVGVHMEQPSFIKDIPSSGLTPPQVDGSFLFFFQALLEHSGDIAGLHGALLSKSGAMRACTTGQ